jgi:uncharacterized protein (TIGR00730 family)
VNKNEEKQLYAGPQPRWKELRFTFRILGEFIQGFRALHFVGPCVTIFGSARFEEGHVYYKLAREMGAAVSFLGFTVMTGGGPGIMEAANRGAQEAGGRSVGCNIRLPQEQEPNRYLDRFVTIDHFFVRKVMLFKYSYAFIMLPGGFGTMDEFFEALTLIQTGKIQNFPLVVMGTEYWGKLRELVDGMLKAGTISAADTKLLFYTDSVEEAAAFIAAAVQEFGIISPPNPLKILGESPLRKEPAAHHPTTRG